MGKEMQVYPNPTTDFVTIHMGDAMPNKPRSLVVMDVMGRSLFFESNVSPQAIIDVSQWPSGVYIIRIEQDDALDVQKFVKR